MDEVSQRQSCLPSLAAFVQVVQLAIPHHHTKREATRKQNTVRRKFLPVTYAGLYIKIQARPVISVSYYTWGDGLWRRSPLCHIYMLLNLWESWLSTRNAMQHNTTGWETIATCVGGL